MINFRILTITVCTTLMLSACSDDKKSYDASGSFEAEETIISSEATGMIKELDIEDGRLLKAEQTIGYIDTIQLYLKKKQLEAQIKAIGSRLPDIAQQTNFYNQQIEANRIKLKNLERERQRYKKLVEGDAATTKQLDDLEAQITELKKQIEVIVQQKNAQESVLQTQVSGMKADPLPLTVQIEQINDQLEKCKIVNPINGTVITQYAKQNEMATIGKALYKVADMSTIILRAYISGNQLAQIKVNQIVKVFTDDGQGSLKETQGTIIWINDKAEFTPKTIQTKDERANMVYATKIKLVNDGSYKIGMYGEIKFQ